MGYRVLKEGIRLIFGQKLISAKPEEFIDIVIRFGKFEEITVLMQKHVILTEK
jgi:hypothetical protein